MSIADDVEKVIYESFGFSNYLFYMSVKSLNKDADVNAIKENFIRILGYMLKEKKIMLTAPDADVTRTPTHIPKLTIYDKEAQWNANPEDAMQYFRDRWPQNISDPDDEELVCYLYTMPGIIWIANDGSLHAS